MSRRAKPGPKVDPTLGSLSPRTVMLDDRTVELAKVVGSNLSDGIRKAVRTAYRHYQNSPDEPAAPGLADEARKT